MTKPTFASVTEQLCECRFLQNAADEPDVPIQFDESTGEFQFYYDEPLTRWQHFKYAIFGAVRPPRASIIFYHCPFCGGAAPPSQRALLFEVIPGDEENRLANLLQKIKTVDDALKQFGPADMDSYVVSKAPEWEGEPPTVERHRYLQYHNLSSIANVCVHERADGSASWQLQGKPKMQTAGNG